MSELRTDDELIDNAAGCAQFRPLCSDMDETDESLRECIKLNVCKPLRDRIAALEAENAWLRPSYEIGLLSAVGMILSRSTLPTSGVSDAVDDLITDAREGDADE